MTLTQPNSLRPLALTLVGFACLAAGSARAETSPYYIGASQRFAHNSNVFLNTDALAKSDTISSTGVRLGIDQPISRQRLIASFSANANRYSSLSALNNTDYALDTRLDWETVDRLSGNVALSSRESLPTDAAALSSGLRNLLKVNSASVQANLGLVTMWSFDAGAAVSRASYSEAVYARNNTNQMSINAGARVTPASGLTLRAGLRHANVSYPNASNDVRRNDLDFSATVNPGGASVFNGRISLTREHQSLVDRNLSNWTGALGWNWKPTGKLSTNLSLSRDSSNGSYDFSTGTINVGSSNSTIATTLGLTTQWEVTSKIAMVGNLSHARRSLDNSLTIGTGVTPASASDSTNSLGLSVQYAVLRNVDLGCGVTWSERSVSSTGATALTAPYSATTYSCFGQALLR
ncbi:hypothetical protein [Sphaerotilus sp.]|uniref:hypothetical protein n=1 Tax=Sphaerotilus sp. TaxID=2093942 RepID=UPI00286E208F|nr:hypothetical protein [Sphaerotilus sp.]